MSRLFLCCGLLLISAGIAVQALTPQIESEPVFLQMKSGEQVECRVYLPSCAEACPAVLCVYSMYEGLELTEPSGAGYATNGMGAMNLQLVPSARGGEAENAQLFIEEIKAALQYLQRHH